MSITQAVLAFVIVFVVSSTAAVSQVIAPTGKTQLQASQLILWYDEEKVVNNRNSGFQITNASVDTPVWVHVQIFASSNASPGDPTTAVICSETNFNDFYTPNDTHFYDMNSLFTNDPLNTIFIGDFSNTKGFVVVTPIDAPGTRNAISHQHMFGDTFIFDGTSYGYSINSMGRDAVSFSTGSVVPNGTVLDGVSNGYVLLQPEILKFVHHPDSVAVDIVSIAFRDNYEGVFGYVAEPADAVWTPLIFDEDENPVSCSPVVQNCFFDIGLNEDTGQANSLLGNRLLCPGNDFNAGWVKIAVSGLEGLENELGLWGSTDFNTGGATWMHAEGAATAVAPPPECTVDADCAAGEVCVLEICIAAPGTGGGCAIASTATAGSTAANALVVLIPLLGIGLRSMLRRREEN